METAVAAETIWGNKLYQQQARKALPILVRQAFTHQLIFNSGLAQEVGVPNPRNPNYVLGSIGETLVYVSEEWSKDIPPIYCLVINKYTQLPGNDVYCFVRDIVNTKSKNDI